MALHHLWRMGGGALLLALAVLRTLPVSAVTAQQAGTPAPTYSCEAATPVAGTPAAGHGDMAGMETGTPMADMAIEGEFDQLYIDMMIPHHASIIALAQAALPRLTDERLREIAQAIIDTQSSEIEDLRGYRDRFYGSAEPAPLDEHTMGMMMQAMPGMGSMEAMELQMDPAAQVAAFCAAADPDLAFVDHTIPHHDMAIVASETALSQATHDEITAFAGRVIDAQQREIDELTSIRAELAGEATPAA